MIDFEDSENNSDGSFDIVPYSWTMETRIQTTTETQIAELRMQCIRPKGDMNSPSFSLM